MSHKKLKKRVSELEDQLDRVLVELDRLRAASPPLPIYPNETVSRPSAADQPFTWS